nr:unnamed protein product [Spirometra erinaceieuropaei]
MWFSQGILGALFVWIPVLNHEEFRSNELPDKCGQRPDLQTPAGNYTERKKEAKEHAWPWHQPEVLMEKPARIAPISGCKKVFSSFKADAHVCTEQAFGTSCVGDSGGGLHCPTKDGRWTVYGVASFASPDCVGEFYGCVKMDSVLSWIKETIVIAI